MSSKSVTEVQADSGTNKRIEYLSGIVCNEALQCAVNCKYPLMTQPHTLEVEVNGYSFAVPLCIDVAFLELKAVLQPQMSELTEFSKGKHYIIPPY